VLLFSKESTITYSQSSISGAREIPFSGNILQVTLLFIFCLATSLLYSFYLHG